MLTGFKKHVMLHFKSFCQIIWRLLASEQLVQAVHINYHIKQHHKSNQQPSNWIHSIMQEARCSSKQNIPREVLSFCKSCRSPDLAKILALKCIKQLWRQMTAVNICPSNLARIVTQVINTHHLLPSQRLCANVVSASFASSKLCPLGQPYPTQFFKISQ